MREQGFQRVLLRGLTQEDVGRFIELTAGIAPPPALVHTVYTQTEGNPLFINEVVRLLVQEGELSPETLAERASLDGAHPRGGARGDRAAAGPAVGALQPGADAGFGDRARVHLGPAADAGGGPVGGAAAGGAGGGDGGAGHRGVAPRRGALPVHPRADPGDAGRGALRHAAGAAARAHRAGAGGRCTGRSRRRTRRSWPTITARRRRYWARTS